MKQERLIKPEFGEIEKELTFLSEITGLPISLKSIFPELVGLNERPVERENPYEIVFELGSADERYEIRITITFSNEWSDEWLPVTSWSVIYNNEVIHRAGDSVHTSKSFWKNDLTDTGRLRKYLLEETLHIVGGINVETGLMDFETYTLEGLQDKDSYFENIYLVLMTHMRQIGTEMPPILIKRPGVAEAMESGDIDVIDRITKTIEMFEMPGYDQRCQAHILREIAGIRKNTNWEKNKRDPRVALTETFPGLEVEVIEKGKSVYPPSNILVVENDLNVYGEFTSTIQEALSRDRRYKGTQVIRHFNLPFCIDLVRTGKIDLIICDWSKPSNWEALMLGGERNPFFDLTQGDIQGILELDGARLEIGSPDGSVIDPKDLKEIAERIDIRFRWMEAIASACVEEGLTLPPHFIVRNKFELGQIAQIISQKLGRSIN